MRFVQKYQTEILVSGGIVLLYFVTRLLFLTNLPIFTDEAIYIRWAQIALHDASWRFISLTDGKPPMQTWLMFPFLKFIQDPLLAGRLLSVCTGFFSMIGIWFLSLVLFKNRPLAFISAFLYIFYPLAVLHDRLAIEDSMAAMWYIWALILSIILVRKMNLVNSYNLGVILGAGVLTKSGAFISMALLPFLLFLFDFKQKEAKQKLFRLIGLGILAVVIGFTMYSVLRLSPLYGMISTKNETFIYPLNEWLPQTLLWKYQLFLGNFKGMSLWLIQYLQVFYCIFLVIGLAVGNFWKEKTVLFVYFILPFLFACVFGKVLFPRYFLFMTDILLPIIALGIYETTIIISAKQKKLFSLSLVGLTFVALLPSLYTSSLLIVDPVHAPIPAVDHYQYIADWPAGWGVKETIHYINQVSANQKVYLATQGTFGLTPFAFEMYLLQNKNVTIKGYWPIEATIPADLMTEARKMPTYIFFYEPCSVVCPSTGIAPATWPVTPVLTVTQERAHATLYQVNQ